MEWQFGIMQMTLLKLFSFSPFSHLGDVQHEQKNSKYFSFAESMLIVQLFHSAVFECERSKIL